MDKAKTAKYLEFGFYCLLDPRYDFHDALVMCEFLGECLMIKSCGWSSLGGRAVFTALLVMEWPCSVSPIYWRGPGT